MKTNIGTIPATTDAANHVLRLDCLNDNLRTLDGTIDEVRIWPTVRCPEEIVYYKDCELTESETGLEAYYQFNQGISEGTNTGVSNDGFEIQWATVAMNNEQLGNNNWETIGFVNGRGTTNEVQNYQFMHDRPTNGTNYYRLKQVDFDGKFEYSDIEAVRFENNQNTPVQIFPNPVKEGALTIRLDVYDEKEI